VSQVEGASGAGVARADLDTFAEDFIGVPVPLGESVIGIEASLEALELRLRAGLR
jgi:hypothetical protein